ncbi:hypothetical protein F4778DRAFT_802652 [Xylariomycetidae sp. FL2044]|nr:hypothetical protein F4778DRAFT_802652 [Xylariomycetidae sp. FL2044]
MRSRALFTSLVSWAWVLPFSILASCQCGKPLIRKEWRTLSSPEKQEYLSAVKCLQNTPGKTANRYPGVRSRYDDFQGEHINQTDNVHFVGFFHAWHRMFVAQYESDLRSYCGYTGAQPYWDWSIDATSADDFLKAPVFDPVDGFGGNGPYVDSSNDPTVRLHIPGKTGGGCVADGPFQGMEVNMGPGQSTAYNPRCLKRDIAPGFAADKLSAATVEWALQGDNFFEFDKRVQGGITVEAGTYHAGGHLGIGGDLGDIADIYSSPGDPLFFMHHSNIDRLWYTWQRMNWGHRKSDIAGPDVGFAYPYDFFGTSPAYHNITLDFEMKFHDLIPDAPGGIVKVSEVMNPRGGRLCYKYE